MDDNQDGFLIRGESLGRIGRVTREVETNSGIGPPEQRRKRGLRSILEGVFTEDLAACEDPNVPTTAKFQIKTLVRADNGWKNEDSPSIVPVLNRTPSAWAEGDIATIEELYPDKYFVRGNNDPFWAVNIGTCAGPTLSVAAGVITGQTSGIAALLSGVTFTNAEVTDDRQPFMRMDDGGAIADGTLIQLQIVSGNMCCVFANCGPTTGLTGLEAEPG